MNSLETPTIVQAIYSFKGKNNDELNFKKGDFITITQKDEGGWWEGTLDGKTGWFPSNYVKDARGQDLKSPSGGLVVESSAEQQKAYRNLILKDIVDSEKSHVTEIQNLFRNVLTPLGSSDILSKAEFNQLSGNLSEIVDLHVRFLNTLEECQDKSGGEQRVGRVFLNTAEQMKTVHTEYCANHPKAVCILERHKDKLGTFVEGLGCSSPGLVFLTVGLSRPFRRLERYAGSLQELERHMEEFHPDRGDTQRSLFLYQNLASSCAAVRRQKQQELDVLCGSVRNWEGDEAHRLGELLYMGPVKLLTGPSEVKDRHFVLFSQCVVLLSVSQRLSAFVFERKVPLIGASLTAVEDKEGLANALEISGSGSERMLIGCPSSEERQRLIDLLHKQMNCEAPISLTTSSSLPYVSSRLPYRALTRTLAKLIRCGRLTGAQLRDILDSLAERERRLKLGLTLLDPSWPVGNRNFDLDRFRRRCKTEVHLSVAKPQMSSDSVGSPKAGSLFVEKELVLGIPLTGDEDDEETVVASSRSSSLTCLERLTWARELSCHSVLDFPLSSQSSWGRIASRSQSLPPSFHLKGPDGSCERNELKIQVTAPTPSSSDLPPSVQCDPPSASLYRSTLYAHWWLKARFSAATVKAPLFEIEGKVSPKFTVAPPSSSHTLCPA